MSETIDSLRRSQSPGFAMRLRMPGRGDSDGANAIAWSCDGKRLAVVHDAGGEVWDVDLDTWESRRSFSIDSNLASKTSFVVWSPVEPDLLAFAHGDTIALLRINADGCGQTMVWQLPYNDNLGIRAGMSFSPTGEQIAIAHPISGINVIKVSTGGEVYARSIELAIQDVRWSPSGRQIAVFGYNESLIFSPFDDSRSYPLTGFERPFMWATWAPDGASICVAGRDHSVRVWDAFGRLRAVLEGHISEILGVEFSHDGRLLYSVGLDRELRCWRTDTWQCVATLETTDRQEFIGGLVANPAGPVLARRAPSRQHIELFEIDVDQVLMSDTTLSRTYANAKVVLLGETGVGKSGLGLVLSGQPYQATDSTHARQVWTFDVSEAEVSGGLKETREILLWDLAGQPGYRLIHQLHLVEAAVALVVFDARSESDPFAGVQYWTRVLRQYRQVGEARAAAILVAARVDRGGIPVSRQRIAVLCDELGIADYLETSAKDGRGIADLAEAIRRAIDWDALPRSVSTELFETIKRFLIEERDTERVLAPVEDLFRAFLRRHPERSVDGEMQASFETCVRLLEGRDLVRRLSFGGFLLLRPELLDSYASALIIAARDQPDGLGFIAEDAALAGRFPIPEDAQLHRPDEERLLLIATVEELLRHDLALREPTDGGVDLIFPSQFTQDRPDAPDSATSDVVFRFDGALTSIYATLAVRLSHVAAYQREEMWRNASTYGARVGGRCGLRVREVDEGRGELTLFFDEFASEETRFLFEDYVHAHLTKRALPGSVLRERVFTCHECGYRVPTDLVSRRQGRGNKSMACPDCETVRISLLDREDRLGVASMQSVREMNESADEVRDRAAATAIIRGKEALGDYDVFLSYNSSDRAAVGEIAERLRVDGVLPWFDTRDIPPGKRWHDELERQIRKVTVGAVFVGPRGLGPWQRMEQEAFVNESARREFRIVPVLLPGVRDDVELPVFLGQWQVVDFRVVEPDPFCGLLSAIAGERWRGGGPS